jgi:prepilin-type N-terminal cleavage/methylation domain-containing protein
MQRNKQGFTLIELIVVIAILAILAVALIPLINNFIEKSRISRIMTTASTLETAAVAFNADVAVFPDKDELNNLVSFNESQLQQNDESLANWDGPYLNRNTEGISPWGSSLNLTRQQMNTVGEDSKEEYVLVVEDSETANVPTASVNDIDNKIDGSLNNNEGKVQAEEDSEILIAIIADAFLSAGSA